jgi:hypothetical protein
MTASPLHRPSDPAANTKAPGCLGISLLLLALGAITIIVIAIFGHLS